VFQEKIDEALGLVPQSSEKKIAFGLAELRIDEGTRLKGELFPINVFGDGRRQLFLVKSRCVGREPKALLKKLVVGLMDEIGGRLCSRRRFATLGWLVGRLFCFVVAVRLLLY
jgi:hypothetical protein